MTIEEPLVTWQEIATFLKVSIPKAKKVLRKANVPLIESYKPTVAVFRSALVQRLKIAEGETLDL